MDANGGLRGAGGAPTRTTAPVDGTDRLRAAFEGAAVGMVLKDVRGRVLQSNPALRRMLGYDGEEELRGTPRSAFTHPEDVGEDAELYGRLLAGELESYRLEKRYLRKDGRVFWGRVSVSRIGGAEGGGAFAIGVVEDVDERRRAEEALGASERRFRAVVEQSPLSVHVFAPDGRSVAANRSWNELWNLEEGEEPEGTSVFEDEQIRATGLMPHVEKGASGEASESEPLLYDPARTGRAGEPRWLRALVYPVRDGSGSVSEVALLIEDVTERKELEDRIAHQALHDPLTGLPNRALLLDRLRQALARARRRPGRDAAGRGEGAAVLFLDLDNFKVVNDSLGHEAGDGLLVEAARRLEARLRPGDTVARLGGDEFVVLLEEVADEAEALGAAERVAGALAGPFALGGNEVFASASVGVAMGGGAAGPARSSGVRPGGEAEELLRKADLAMYEAKRRGKARCALYEEAMGVRAGARLKLESDLRRAVKHGEFVVHYQPKVSLASGRVVGVEALARWRHPERGLVLPGEFVALAEETGLIVPIGHEVLGRACAQAREWRDLRRNAADGERPPTVWVNLSARQLHEPDLPGRVSAVLEESGLEPGGLGLEVTESVLVEGVASISLLEELKALGVKLAVDDFGTGYSSLSYLKRLPVDYLKIDRSFVSGLGDGDGGDATIVRAVVGLARAMGLGVVAEGVETREQLESLREMGCDLAQGYHLSPPLPVGEASRYVLRGPSPRS